MQFQHFIQLTVDDKLESPIIKKFFNAVSVYGPKNIIGSYQTVAKKGEKVIRLLHKKINGKHLYLIPLNRDLLNKETKIIVQQWDSEFKKDFDIETSAVDLNTMKRDHDTAVLLKDYDMEEFAEKVAIAMHNRWYHKKSEEGWRYGAKFDQRGKVNPMMKPWNELAEEYKNVDPNLPEMFLQLLGKEGYTVMKTVDFDLLVRKSLQGF
jgi:hypothetical protein